MENAAFRGGLTEVWKGQYEGREVAIQFVKVLPGDDTERLKRVSCRWCGWPVICTTYRVS